MHVLKKNSLKS